MPTSLSTKNRRFSNIFSKMRIVPLACVATASAIDVRSAGNAGHGPSSIFGIWSPRSSCTCSSWPGGTCTLVLELDAHAEPREVQENRHEVLGRRLVDPEIAAGDGGEADEARDLDVLRRDPVLAAAEPIDAVDPRHVRLDPLDLRAERDEDRQRS